jgi:hypothetical protein
VSIHDVNPPESPRISEARIVAHPTSGNECLLVRDADGRDVAFSFELESDAPGISQIDPAAWRSVAETAEDSLERFDAIVEARADEWLPTIAAHPIGAEWLRRLEEREPAAYHAWFAQTQYETGGEEGSG